MAAFAFPQSSYTWTLLAASSYTPSHASRTQSLVAAFACLVFLYTPLHASRTRSLLAAFAFFADFSHTPSQASHMMAHDSFRLFKVFLHMVTFGSFSLLQSSHTRRLLAASTSFCGLLTYPFSGLLHLIAHGGFRPFQPSRIPLRMLLA